MRSALLPVLLIAGMTLSAAPAALGQDQTHDPDQLYADRANLASAREAASIWEARLKGAPKDFEAAWKLARATYWLGGHVPADERRAQYERGIDAATRAIAIDTRRPEGHFWLAANMGVMAESFGLRAGIKYKGPVKRELETVLSLDPGYQEGSADRALGRWYLRVPYLFGGSKTQSVEHLKKSLTYDPGSAASHYFLAETYIEMDRYQDARGELQKVIDAPLLPAWIPEVNEFKVKARALLQTVSQK